MKRHDETTMPFLRIVVASWLCAWTSFASSEETYPGQPDAVVAQGVPRGVVTQRPFNNSEIYPGTTRDVFVYVPAQYDGKTPAAVMVFQDGENYVRKNSSWNLPVVFDNLIARGDMPVTIAICINPGVVSGNPDVAPESDQGTVPAQDRFNRSLEYDAVSDRYARFLTEEILPEIGKDYQLTDDPNLRGIGGSSSGAIAAFGVAWHRPGAFRRVFSTIGTYVGLRGGDEYHSLIRKTEPKPLRVFLQDGSDDLNIYGGDWWNANRTMLSALQWAGYAVEHRWGTGGHNAQHGSAIFPDAMKWLWANDDQPITTTIAKHPEFSSRLIDNQPWRKLNLGIAEPTLLCGDGQSGWFVLDAADGQVSHYESPEDLTRTDVVKISGATTLSADGAGGLWVVSPRQVVYVVRKSGLNFESNSIDELKGWNIDDLLTAPSHSSQTIVFAGHPPNDPSKQRIYTFSPGMPPTLAEEQIAGPKQIAWTPDHRFLQVAGTDPRYIWSARFRVGGNFDAAQPYHHVHHATDAADADVRELRMLRDGSLVAGTSIGLQIFDQPGRVHCIIPLVSHGGVAGFDFVGQASTHLVASDGRSLWIRATKMEGVNSYDPPETPNKPNL